MKQFLILSVCMAALLSCAKNEDNPNTPPARETYTSEAVLADKNFTHLTFDSAYFYQLDWQLAELCETEGMEMPDLDLDGKGIIALTGVAPAEIESFQTEFYVENGVHKLAVKGKVKNSDCVLPSQWSLFVCVENLFDPDAIECDISYDMDFNTMQIPPMSYIVPTYKDGDYSVILHPVDEIKDAYLVVMERSKLHLLKAAADADERCVFIDEDGVGGLISPNGTVTAMFRPYIAPVAVEDCKAVVLKDCDYDKVIAPLGDDILFARGGGYKTGSAIHGSVYAFCTPSTRVALKTDANKEYLKRLALSLGYDKDNVIVHQEGNSTFLSLLDTKQTKVNAWQFNYLLYTVAGQSLVPFINEVQYYCIMQDTFDNAVKGAAE